MADSLFPRNDATNLLPVSRIARQITAKREFCDFGGAYPGTRTPHHFLARFVRPKKLLQHSSTGQTACLANRAIDRIAQRAQSVCDLVRLVRFRKLERTSCQRVVLVE
jgi:hypothetical protein